MFKNVTFLQDQDKEYVGFATLPIQANRKAVKKGFTFTLMVAGKDLMRRIFHILKIKSINQAA